VLNLILSATRDEIHTAYKLIVDRHEPLLRVLSDLNAPPLEGLNVAVELVLNTELRSAFEGGKIDATRLRSLFNEVKTTKVNLDKETIAYACKLHFDRLSEKLLTTPCDLELLKQFIDDAKLLHELPFDANLWKPQNIYVDVSSTLLAEMKRRAAEGEEQAKTWTTLFAELGLALGFSPALATEDPVKPSVEKPEAKPVEELLESVA
jgi:hypothetical protein